MTRGGDENQDIDRLLNVEFVQHDLLVYRLLGRRVLDLLLSLHVEISRIGQAA